MPKTRVSKCSSRQGRGREASGLEWTYTVILRTEPEGGFTILVPVLPEIVSHGRTPEEARRMATDAIECALRGRQELGEPIPEEGPLVTVPAEERTGDLHLGRVTVALPEAVAEHA